MHLVTTIYHKHLEQISAKLTGYSVATTVDLIRLWRSKVKVTAGCGKGMHVESEFVQYCDQCVCMSVCLSVCMSVCLSVRLHMSKTAYPNFTKFSAVL